jgi:ankyrin repeat protein
LHYAALNDRSDIAKLLLEANAIADGVNHRGQTPLSIAVARNSLALARVLLLNNANPNIQDRKKDSPLHIAVRDNNLPMAKLLLAHGAAVGIRDQSNRDAFELARDLDSAKLIGLLSRKNDEGRRGNIKRRWMKNRAGQHDPAAPNNKDSTSLD